MNGGLLDGELVPAHAVVAAGLAASPPAGGLVIVEDVSEAEVRFANNTITTNGVRRDRRVTAVALHRGTDGVSIGVATGAGAQDVGELMTRAGTDAREAPPAEDAVPLLGPDDAAVRVRGSGTAVAGGTGRDAGAVALPDSGTPSWTERPPETGLDTLQGVLRSLGDAFGRARADGHVLAGFAEHRLETATLGTSTGLQRRHIQPTGALHLVARSTDGERSAWAGTGTADFADVAVEDLAARLRTRLGWAARQVRTDAGRYEVILPPDAVADLMIGLADALSLREAEEGRTVFSAPGGRTRVGERLSPLPVTLDSDPVAPGIACRPFHLCTASGSDLSVCDNGLALTPTAWLDDGRLARLRAHRAGAARSGVPVAAPIDNLRLTVPGAHGSLEDLVAHTERGLLLTCLWYIREVDPATLLLTGLTRDGVYVVEDGEVIGATNNFRFNESPVGILGRIQEASATQRALGREFGEWCNRTAMPALRVADFHMSSVSDSS